MPTLKGKWYFKEILTYPESSILFEAPGAYFGVEAGDYPKQVISVSSSGGLLQFYDDTAWNGGNYLYTTSWTAATESGRIKQRTLIFLQPIDVSQDLYNWFTKNAINLQPTGTWRFNKTLKLPDHSIYTNYGPNAPYYATCGYSNGVTIYEIGANSGNFYYNTGTSNVDSSIQELYHNNSWNVYDTNTEVYRNIEFVSGITLDPEFALWFYENAHSMELKLYSECYIAETADKIRECANDNTLTFKVSDLADGVQLAYDAGYSKGSSENSLDLEALGALCDWEIMTNYESYPIIAITNHHPTYYLKCTIQDIDGDSILDTEDDSEYPNGVVTVPPNSTTISVYIEYPFSDIDPITISDMRWTADE